MLFSHIMQEDRRVLELIDADYTFLNERLAEHYGIPDIEGREMRKVKLEPDSHRGGILTQGTFLTVTSNPTRTSAVKRGLFISENILGTPVPPAPGKGTSVTSLPACFGPIGAMSKHGTVCASACSPCQSL